MYQPINKNLTLPFLVDFKKKQKKKHHTGCFIILPLFCKITYMVCMHSETHLPPEALENLISVWVFWACFLWSLPTEQGHSCLPDKPQWTRGPFRNLTPKTKNKTKKTGHVWQRLQEETDSDSQVLCNLKPNHQY